MTLLELAATQIAGKSPHSNRMAAWLARTALEQTVHDLLVARGVEPGRASGRARLACLEVAYDDSPDIAARAQYAWTRLSEACHQHAYQLSPTYQEVQHLLDAVGVLRAALEPGTQSAEPPE